MGGHGQEGGGTLSSAFNKISIGSILHAAMVVAMGTMALAGVASLMATGMPVGVFDAVGMYLNMHIPSMENLAMLGDAAGGIWDSALQGQWVTSGFWADPHALMAHGAHTGHAAAAAGAPVISESFMAMMGAPS